MWVFFFWVFFSEYTFIDKSWTNKEWNESVPKPRMICWSKRAIYIYLWLMGQAIGTWINCQNVCAYIILSAFFPYNTLVPHFTEAETGGKICILLLSSALNMFNIWVLPAFGSFNYCVYWFFVVGVFFSNSSDLGTAVHDSTVLRTSRDK